MEKEDSLNGVNKINLILVIWNDMAGIIYLFFGYINNYRTNYGGVI